VTHSGKGPGHGTGVIELTGAVRCQRLGLHGARRGVVGRSRDGPGRRRA